MAAWPGKKDKGDPSQSSLPDETALASASAESGDDADQLQQLTSHLCDVGQLLNQANEQVASYLLHRESSAKAGTSDDGALATLGEKIDALADKLARLPTDGPAEVKPSDARPTASSDTASSDPAALESLLRPLQEQLAQIDAKISTLPDQTAGSAQEKLSPELMQLRDGINQQFGNMSEGIQYLQQQFDAGMQNLAEQLAPEQPEEPAAATAAGMADWQQALLGVDLAELPGLEAYRYRLLEGVLQGNEGACALVGQLLTFRSAMTDKMPKLLKDLGEAYYRWQPKTRPGSDPMETALVDWLKETLKDAGISNTIEVVHPGERFDSTRHNAATRGVEITEVRGWIVLRDNGKVYTKAAVAVQ